MISESNHVYDDRTEGRQGGQHPDKTSLLPSDQDHKGAPEFQKLENGHCSGEGDQIAATVGLFHAYQLHQPVLIIYLDINILYKVLMVTIIIVVAIYYYNFRLLLSLF